MRTWCCGIVSLLLLLTTSAQAVEPVTLDPIVVTATRTARPASEVGPSVSVITAEQIASSGAVRLEEVLSAVPGLEAISNGTPGSVGSVSLRGSEPQQVLVLLDGVRLNSPQNGQFNLSDLPVPVQEIERIEVLRGPGSALYGPSALGGVVQIFTKRPEDEPLTSVTWREGSDDTRSAAFSTSRQGEIVGYRFAAGKDVSQGYRTNSDLDQTVLDGVLSFTAASGVSLELGAHHLQKEVGVPGSTAFPSPEARQEASDTLASARVTGSVGDTQLRIGGQYARFDSRYEDPGAFFPIDDRHITETASAEAQADWQTGVHALTAAGEFSREFIDSTANGNQDQGRWALLAQDEVALGSHVSLLVGARYDAHSDFSNEWSPRSSLVVRPGEATTLRASVGRAYRPPTFNDRFWPFDGFARGNPDLSPETAWEYELGVSQSFADRATLSLTGFRRDAEDLIDWQPEDPTDPFGVWSPVNVSRSRTQGAETSLEVGVGGGLSVGGNYTYLHAVDRETDEFLPGKPRHQANGYAQLEAGQDTRLRVTGRYARYYPEQARSEASYTVFDAALTQGLYVNDEIDLELTFSVKNLLDRDYEINAGYPMPPRQWHVGVSAMF